MECLNEIEKYSEHMEYLNEIEKYSVGLIKQSDNYFELTEGIKWFANAMDDYQDEKISEYYKNNEYGKTTRWDIWSNSIDALKKHGIKSMVDIGCGNGHFVYLAQKNSIESFGVEPRKNIIESYQGKFIKEFGHKKLFLSNYECLIDFLVENEDKNNFKVDCICAINYMHGPNHNPKYLEKFFNNIFNFCDYLLTSEPAWQTYGLPDLLSNAQKIECIAPLNQHFLFSKKK